MTRMKPLFLAAAVVLAAFVFSVPAFAELKTQTIEYTQGDATLKSYLAVDEDAPLPVGATKDHRPGILVVPEWWGLESYAKTRADQLAKLGYVALAVDVYGDAQSTSDPKQAGELAGKYKSDRPLFRERIKAALDTLKKQNHVDPSKTAAIGYCFGGTAVLELARSGADVLGVASFHGGLDAPPGVAGQMPSDIKAKVLVLHGANDGFVPQDQIKAFIDELNARHADWQMIVYSGANHGFTNKDADSHHIPGLSYNANADARSWKALQEFLNEIFK